MTPVLLHAPAQMREWRSGLASNVRVGFVPTMGALHEGHADLLRRMRRACDRLVLSIFVNPAQFGPNEDLAQYPRTYDRDLEIAHRCGVDAVFFPTPAQMYPPGYSTYVDETALTGPLCGEFRPGHFRGVTTVVLKLFNLVEPHVAYFGLKDAQQFFVLHKMVRDLNLRVSVEGVATVREPDGLALSSRNRYLSVSERKLAPALQRELGELSLALIHEGSTASALLEQGRARLTTLGIRVQYLEHLTLPELKPAKGTSSQPGLVAVAAYLGTTRLIDNVILRPELLAGMGMQIHSFK